VGVIFQSPAHWRSLANHRCAIALPQRRQNSRLQVLNCLREACGALSGTSASAISRAGIAEPEPAAARPPRVEYFSRLRRAEIGIHHHIARAYLLRYAQEPSWREDNRRVSNGDQVNRVAALA
jgi:hypothetical protein